MRIKRNAKQIALPKSFSPQLAVLVAHAPKGEGWVHEIKFDGYRLLAFVRRGRVRLLTRRGHDWTDAFPSIATALERLKVDSAVIDGELVTLDQRGRSDFQLLQASMSGAADFDPVFYAFDLPFCDGADLTSLPLIERKARLDTVLAQSKLAPRVAYSAHVTAFPSGRAGRLGPPAQRCATW